MHHHPHSGLPLQPQPHQLHLRPTATPAHLHNNNNINTPPQPSSSSSSSPFLSGLHQQVPPAGAMASAGKAAIFTTIANMARQVCAVSEKAAKEGILGGLDYVLLQSLGYAIAQHVSLIELPPVSTSTAAPVVAPTSTLVRASSPPSSPAPHVAVDVRTASSKRKSAPSTTTSSSTTSTSSKRRKEEAALALATSSPSPNTSDDEPIKRCRDCGRTKTNQWRSGPEGMSTLCNACGMRYTRRMKRQVGVPALSPNVSRRNSVLDSPLCGHDSDHGGLSPVSSPLPFGHQQQHSPMLDDSSAAPDHHHHHQEKRSNLYNLLN